MLGLGLNKNNYIKPIIPSNLKANCLLWLDAQKRNAMNYTLTNALPTGVGDFETDTGGVATGWAVFSVDGNFELSTDAKSGTKAQRLYYTNTSGSAKTMAITSTDYIGATTGDKVLVTLWLKKNAAQNNTNGIAVGLNQYNSSNTFLGGDTTTHTLMTSYTRFCSVVTLSKTGCVKIKPVITSSVPDTKTTDYVIDACEVVVLKNSFSVGTEPISTDLDYIFAQDGTVYWEGAKSFLCNPSSRYYWYDYSGNSNTAKFSNLAYSAGSTISSNGFEVDGVDDYGTIADTVATRLATGGTLSAWIYPKTSGEENNGIIFSKDSQYALSLVSTFLLFSVRNEEWPTQGVSNSIILNTWQHVAVTFNGTGRKIYVNGVDKTDIGGDNTLLPTNTAGTVLIGGVNTNMTFDGYIDKASIFNRALTQAEVVQLFNNSKARYGV